MGTRPIYVVSGHSCFTMADEFIDEQTKRVLRDCEVDSSTPLGIKHLAYVRAAFIGVSTQWFNIGIHFRIEINKLDKFRKENRNDVDRCLTAMLADLLVSPPVQIGTPTWRKMVIAIASRVGGDNPREALRIAREYKNGIESIPEAEGVPDIPLDGSHIEPVLSALKGGVAHKWMEIGLFLGVPYGRLMAMKFLDGVDEQVREMARVWLEGKCDTDLFGKPSWKKLVEAVGARAGGHNLSLARDIAKKTPHVEARPTISHGTVTDEPDLPVLPLADTPLGDQDFRDITGYLLQLTKDQIYPLGIELGLSYRWLKDGMDSRSYRDDVVDAWLKKQDDVGKRCPPTWRNLVTALRSDRVKQNGIARRIATDKEVEM